MSEIAAHLEHLIREPFLAGGRWLGECSSTNDLLLAEQTPTPYLLGTDVQTAGRGRPGKTWLSGPGALTFSIAVSAADVLAKRELIDLYDASPGEGVSSLAVGVAVCEAIERLTCGASFQLASNGPTQSGSSSPYQDSGVPQVKWPNDILIGGRKVAGILIETRGDRTVIGVGLNVNNDPPSGLEATSLKAAFGVEQSLPIVLSTLVFRLLDEGLRWDDEILGALRGHDALFGQQVVVSSPTGDNAIGTATGITSRGELIVDDQFVTSGSVRVVDEARSIGVELR